MMVRRTAAALLLLLGIGLWSSCDADKNRDRAGEISEEVGEGLSAVGLEPAGAEPPSDTHEDAVGPDEFLAEATATDPVLLGLSREVALDFIDRWIRTLEGNRKVDDFDILVSNLRALETQLQSGSPDPEALEDIFESLARETKQAAKDNDSEVVERIAELLDEAAEALDD